MAFLLHMLMNQVKFCCLIKIKSLTMRRNFNIKNFHSNAKLTFLFFAFSVPSKKLRSHVPAFQKCQECPSLLSLGINTFFKAIFITFDTLSQNLVNRQNFPLLD